MVEVSVKGKYPTFADIFNWTFRTSEITLPKNRRALKKAMKKYDSVIVQKILKEPHSP